MKLSARNQIPGTITNVKEGSVSAIVTLDASGITVTGTISVAAVRELGLEKGAAATAVIKATEVMVGLEKARLSARNQFPGKITNVHKGNADAAVTLSVHGGHTITATISVAAVEELGLEAGMDAVAVIKATSVMFGV